MSNSIDRIAARRGKPSALGLLFLTMAGVLVISVFVNYWMGRAAVESNRALTRQQVVIDQIQEILSTMKDAETGLRGFLLTQNEKYLEPYNAAQSRIGDEIQAVDELSGKSILSAEDVVQLKERVKQTQVELEKTLDLCRKQGAAEAIKYVQSDRGKIAMDRVRALSAEMVAKEKKELTYQQEEAIRLARYMTLTFAATIVVNLAFLGWAYRRIVREVSRREAVADELREQKEMLGVTLASIGDGVIVTDDDARITFMNQIAETLTGWSLQDALGQPCGSVFNIVNETSRQLVDSPVQKVLREGVIVGLANHTLLIRRDGTELPIDDSGAPIRDAGGRVRGVILVFRDFTEHKKAERQLEQNESRYRALVTAAAQVNWVTNAEGQIIEDSPTWRTFTGQTYDEWRGWGWLDAIHPDDRKRAAEVWSHAVAEKATYLSEYRVRRPDGSYRWMLARGVPVLGAAGKIVEWVGMNTDITDRIEGNQKLQQSKEEAEAANIAKDNFLATLSHELRTPLTPVAATLTAWESDSRLPASLIEEVQMMRRNVDLEARLIDDLLDLTRIVRGKLSLNLEIADVHKLIDSVANMYQSEMQSKKLSVTKELRAEGFHVFADPARLQQVFLNLLKNATKFTPEGGKIKLLTCNEPPGQLSIAIHDNGIGMSEELLHRVFLPFEQGSAETIKRYGGLGLGLSISKALMDAQGGTLAATSEGPGQGSTFIVGLPCVNAPDCQEAPVPAMQTPSPQRSLNILLVEDHADTARVMSRLLKNLGHRVSIADTVGGALKTVEGDTFDVLLSDIGLPDGTGIELIRQIRLRSDLPAIALTGYGMEEDVAKCLEAGFDSHLTKPVNFQKLESVIRQLASRHDNTR